MNPCSSHLLTNPFPTVGDYYGGVSCSRREMYFLLEGTLVCVFNQLSHPPFARMVSCFLLFLRPRHGLVWGSTRLHIFPRVHAVDLLPNLPLEVHLPTHCTVFAISSVCAVVLLARPTLVFRTLCRDAFATCGRPSAFENWKVDHQSACSFLCGRVQ